MKWKSLSTYSNNIKAIGDAFPDPKLFHNLNHTAIEQPYAGYNPALDSVLIAAWCLTMCRPIHLQRPGCNAMSVQFLSVVASGRITSCWKTIHWLFAAIYTTIRAGTVFIDRSSNLCRPLKRISNVYYSQAYGTQTFTFRPGNESPSATNVFLLLVVVRFSIP